VLFVCFVVEAIHDLKHEIEGLFFDDDLYNLCVVLVPHIIRM